MIKSLLSVAFLLLLPGVFLAQNKHQLFPKGLNSSGHRVVNLEEFGALFNYMTDVYHENEIVWSFSIRGG